MVVVRDALDRARSMLRQRPQRGLISDRALEKERLPHRIVAKSVPVVPAIEDTGLTIMFGNWLIQLSGGTSFGAVMVGTAGAALGTNLINNVPMAVVMISALAGIQHAAPPILHGFIAATIFGCDLGPNLTTVGSLATVLWLLILRQRNVDVSGLYYFKVGVVVTPLMLLPGAFDYLVTSVRETSKEQTCAYRVVWTAQTSNR
jgi:hypothetical protein